eukprot:scaffold1150_cov176-Alexandrium_tamarense.AAC.11
MPPPNKFADRSSLLESYADIVLDSSSFADPTFSRSKTWQYEYFFANTIAATLLQTLRCVRFSLLSGRAEK